MKSPLDVSTPPPPIIPKRLQVVGLKPNRTKVRDVLNYKDFCRGWLAPSILNLVTFSHILQPMIILDTASTPYFITAAVPAVHSANINQKQILNSIFLLKASLSLDSGMIVVIFIIVLLLTLLLGMFSSVDNNWCNLLFPNGSVRPQYI